MCWMNACPKCQTVLTKSLASLLVGISYLWPQETSISPGELLWSTNFLWHFCVSELPLLRNLAKEWTPRTKLNKEFPKGMVARRKHTVVCLLQFNDKLRTLGTLSPVSNLDSHRHLDHRPVNGWKVTLLVCYVEPTSKARQSCFLGSVHLSPCKESHQ